MKRLVSILLLVFAVTTGFAQSSTPDYIQKAKVGITQYYPQFKDYFEPIFTEIISFNNTTRNIINSEFLDYFEIFSEEITSEKEKCTILLVVFELITGNDKFKKTPEIEALKDDVEIAKEIAKGVKIKINKEIVETKDNVNKLNNRNAKLKEIINLINNSTKSRETTENIIIKMEEYFNLNDVSELKDDSGLQNIIKQYINFNKEINRHPNAIGQKFIDEYNRITKSK